MIRLVQIVEPHTETMKKFGSLSRGKKRKLLWKQRTHNYIDQIWNIRGYCTRKEMYKHLQKHLGTNPHVGMMSITKMKLSIEWAIEILNKGKEIDKQYGIEWDYIQKPNFLN